MDICIGMNDTKFDIIDNGEKAYWLGFLYADGWNTEKYYRIGIQLATEDKSHVEKFCDFLEINRNRIRTKPPMELTICGRRTKSSGSASIVIGNKHISSSLSRLGLITKKSLTLKFPSYEQVPFCFIGHFLRGYFDGDGCLSSAISNGARRYSVTILSSKDFCHVLINIVKSVLGIKLYLLKNHHGEKINRVHITGNRQVKKFMDWLYKDRCVFLERKLEKFLELEERKFRETLENGLKFFNDALSTSVKNNIFDGEPDFGLGDSQIDF